MEETEVQPHPVREPEPDAEVESDTGEETRSEPPTLPQRLVEPVMVPRWVQLVLLPLALLGLWELGHAMGTVLVVVVAAGVVALILNPLAKQFQRVVPRGIAIVLSYLTI
ncbi:MAG: hypothetical protein KGL15_06160, partial [Acidobacteriota bacterium]|nr:hypothetical protein [Acidobacteriota bacterium]